MLKKAGESTGLEFNSPAHGNWNIVHTGMLLPESIQIYVCADNCMRGSRSDSSRDECGRQIFLCDRGRRGSSERQSGRCDDRRRYRCIKKTKRSSESSTVIYRVSASFFWDVIWNGCMKNWKTDSRIFFFVRCYMDPIMQKHGLTPDQKLRKAIYDGLKMREEENPKAVTILGSDFALDETSDIRRLLKWKHIEVKKNCQSVIHGSPIKSLQTVEY